VINKIKPGQHPVSYGTDYPTPDRTCIRDYIDVRDIAGAHLSAGDSPALLPFVMNVGTIREVIKMVCETAGRSHVVAEEKVCRAGHPELLCAEVGLLQSASEFSSECPLGANTESLF
jgi:UDP-glucose 4-epimerase